MAGGQGAAAQAGQCVRLVPGAGDGAGQVQGLLVAPLSLREVTDDPVQRPFVVERLAPSLCNSAAKPAAKPMTRACWPVAVA